MDVTSTSYRPHRQTRRKKLIQQLLETTYCGAPVVLDELRWAALGAEIDAGACAGSMVTRSYLNSFARTIREQFPDYAIHKIPIKADTPLGLVARTAVYRLVDLVELRWFLSSSDPCILCRYQTDMHVDEPRYIQRYVTPQHYSANFRFFDGEPARLTYDEIGEIPGTLIPTTQMISIVGAKNASIDPLALAVVPWRLFGYVGLDEWYAADAKGGPRCVQRNRMG